MDPLAVVLIVLGVLLSLLMVCLVKQRGDEIARSQDNAQRQLGFWQNSAQGPCTPPLTKTRAQIEKGKSQTIGERVCSAFRELRVEARLVNESPSAYGGQNAGLWVIEIAEGPICEVIINYSPELPRPHHQRPSAEGLVPLGSLTLALCITDSQLASVTKYWPPSTGE